MQDTGRKRVTFPDMRDVSSEWVPVHRIMTFINQSIGYINQPSSQPDDSSCPYQDITGGHPERCPTFTDLFF